jgi:uncharacterized protein (TIGR03034 family)
MPALQFPCMIFKTQKWMDDYAASDMQCGDLSEAQLKSQFKLVDVSARANPYTLKKIPPFTQRHTVHDGIHSEGEKITRQRCATILFDEFRHLSRTFAVYSPYKSLITHMINHMQKGNGTPFRHMLLDQALKEHILNDRTENSTRLRLGETLKDKIDWENKCYSVKHKEELRAAISRGKLPKFDRLQDNFNGMGITVHDTWATHITIKSLQIENNRYCAMVHYKVQDHFGLDGKDILNTKFHQFRLFRLWFVLQRYNQLGFKPFMTNMEATIKITGGRHGI